MTKAISRSYKRHLTAADRRAKLVIESCIKSGAGIEHITDAPNFRYSPLTPEEMKITSFKGRESCKPSGRGSVACGRKNSLKLKNWTPSKLDANPQYQTPMAGDDEKLTKARQAWHDGDPKPLRAYLEAQKAARQYEKQKETAAWLLRLNAAAQPALELQEAA